MYKLKKALKEGSAVVEECCEEGLCFNVDGVFYPIYGLTSGEYGGHRFWRGYTGEWFAENEQGIVKVKDFIGKPLKII